MAFHIVLGKALDLAKIHADAAAGFSPRHVMYDLADKLGAQIHAPGGEKVTAIDRLAARLAGVPEQWALARAVARELGPDDVVHCTGEDIGIPLATMIARKRYRPKLSMFVHNLDRMRGRTAIKVLGITPVVSAWLTNVRPQQAFLERTLRLPSQCVHWITEQTDTGFFTPGRPSVEKYRPIIASAGLEQRDYRTLAAATADLEAAVRISGFSRDAKVLARAFPVQMPANMSQRFYSWPELVQLYRDADVVVISLMENKFGAGLTTLLEAASCRRPILLTPTSGLTGYLEEGLAQTVPLGDSRAMRHAIEGLLHDSVRARQLAEQAYQAAITRHGPRQWVERVGAILNRLTEYEKTYIIR